MIDFLLQNKIRRLFHPVLLRHWAMTFSDADPADEHNPTERRLVRMCQYQMLKVVGGPVPGSRWLGPLHGAASKHPPPRLWRLLCSDASNHIHHHLLWVPRSPPRRT